MAKMVFYYGSMNSSKSAQLIMTTYNFEQQNKNFIVLKSSTDTRDKEIASRALSIKIPCIPVSTIEDILQAVSTKNPKWIFIDESQFMTKEMIDTLAGLANQGINIVCYGLLTDFTGHLFEGSKRLVECSDSIREIKNQCFYCENKAIRNMRLANNQPVFDGVITLPGYEYRSVCRRCYDKFEEEYKNNKE